MLIKPVISVNMKIWILITTLTKHFNIIRLYNANVSPFYSNYMLSNDWLILTVYQTVSGYFMPRRKGIAFIVHLHFCVIVS